MNEHEQTTPTVYLVDDEPAVRHALRLLFNSVGIEVEEFAGAHAFLDRATPDLCGCLLTDLRMPVMGGIELIEALRRGGCDLPAVVISGHGDIRLAVRALKAGAHDFVEKPFNDQALLDAVNGALNAPKPAAGRPLSGELLMRFATLTPREDAVMRRVIQGLANKQIARELNVSPRTVEAHRAHLMDKLGVASAAELAALAVHAGIAGTASRDEDPRGRGSSATGLRNHRSQIG